MTGRRYAAVFALLLTGLNLPLMGYDKVRTHCVSFREPVFLAAEEAIPSEILKQPGAKGHKIRSVKGLGNAHGLTIEYDENGKPVRFRGGTDTRGEGVARGLDRQ